MLHEYSEDTLVEQPTIALFSDMRLGNRELFYRNLPSWRGIQGRETTAEVVLVRAAPPSAEKLNPRSSPEAIELAINEITRDRSTMSLVHANREIYQFLKEGVKVIVQKSGRGDRQ